MESIIKFTIKFSIQWYASKISLNTNRRNFLYILTINNILTTWNTFLENFPSIRKYSNNKISIQFEYFVVYNVKQFCIKYQMKNSWNLIKLFSTHYLKILKNWHPFGKFSQFHSRKYNQACIQLSKSPTDSLQNL